MKKISYLDLQKKYPEKVVALDKSEQKILAVGTTGQDILNALKRKKLELQHVILVGPIQRKETINVYLESIFPFV